MEHEYAVIGGVIVFIVLLIGGLVVMTLGFDTVDANHIGVNKWITIIGLPIITLFNMTVAIIRNNQSK